MICYRDRIYCPFYETCRDGDTCERALTPLVVGQAQEWMDNPPISQYTEKPECYVNNFEKVKP